MNTGTAQYLFVLIGSLCIGVAALSIDEGWVSVALVLVGLLFGVLSMVAKRASIII